MATYRIHTARKVITTENRTLFGACYNSGEIQSKGLAHTKEETAGISPFKRNAYESAGIL